MSTMIVSSLTPLVVHARCGEKHWRVPLPQRTSSVTFAVTLVSGLATHSMVLLPSTCQLKRRLPEPVPPPTVTVSR
jgi:hypothetical protein